MRDREEKRKDLLYPEDHFKVNWDLYITVVLLVSCVVTPIRIAFGNVEEPPGWIAVNFFIDFCFFVDVIIIFNSAYYDDEYVIIEDRKTIAKTYLKSWFIVDVLAIVPFDYILKSFEDQDE